MRATISPQDVFNLIDTANAEQLSHHFVERSSPSYYYREFAWAGDIETHGLVITLNTDGTWKADVELDASRPSINVIPINAPRS
jgi:hypothetical protein